MASKRNASQTTGPELPLAARFARHAVKPGQPITLAHYDPGAKPFSSGDKARDKTTIAELAERINVWQDKLYAERRRRLLLILQGTDTSGKDGTVRAVFSRVDPLGLRCVAFGVPSPAEAARDYLWRVHREVPAAGELAIFNRSHYEDVLVPRVHGSIDAAECERRYAHIRDFERLLAETGTAIVKCFLHIGRDEQRARLQARLADPDKHWKFNPGDLAERAHWDAYMQAYEAVLPATSTPWAPWIVVPADSKTHRNLMIAQLVESVLQAMAPDYPPPRPEYATLQVD